MLLNYTHASTYIHIYEQTHIFYLEVNLKTVFILKRYTKDDGATNALNFCYSNYNLQIESFPAFDFLFSLTKFTPWVSSFVLWYTCVSECVCIYVLAFV